MPITTPSSGDVITAAAYNANFALCVLTDTSRTITVTHTYSASQTFSAGWTAAAACAITVASATGFAVGRQGATDPALLVHSSTASQATGIQITGKAAASGAAIAVISSGTNENLTVDAKGSGTITLGGTSTGNVVSTRAFVGSNSIKSSHATAGVGYATGAGGTVTQGSSKSTSVSLNTICGQITMHNAALNTDTEVQFQFNNNAIAATDVIVWNVVGGASNIAGYVVTSTQQATAALVSVRNVTGGSLSEAVVLGFAIIKGVTA